MKAILRKPDPDASIESLLLAAITRAQSQYVQSRDVRAVFDGMLEALLHLTESEYGFIGEVLHDADGEFLKTHAITNIAWNDETQRLYDENVEQGLEFRNMNTLFGNVMVTGEPVIANEPATDRRRGGVPEGHPPLNAFLGLPFYHRDSLIGMVGIANRPHGYEEALVDTLKPFLTTCANIILAVRSQKEQAEIQLSLKESEARGRAILENATDGIITVDADGRLESGNRAAGRIFGYGTAELVGMHLSELVPEDRAGDDRAVEFTEAGSGRVLGVPRQLIGRHRDGTEFPIEMTVNELQLEGRQLVVAMLRDITERMAVEEETTRLTAELTVRVEELDRLNEENAMLSELGSYLQASLTKEEAYDVLLAHARALFPEESGALYRLSEGSNAQCVLAWGDERYLLSHPVQKHDCWAMRRGELHEAGTSRSSLRCRHYNGIGDGHQLCVPVMTQNGPIGLLTLHVPSRETATASDGRLARNRSILMGIADRLGPTLSGIELRMRLQEDSIRDPLTKLYNRRFMAESLHRELLRAKRAESPLSVIMFDLDHFKRINDEYGHDVGDQVLVLLAQQLSQTVREEDLVYRYGGEEFLILLPGASLEVAKERAQDACRATRALRIETDKGSLHVTISAGVATYPEHGTDEEALLGEADKALYAAKESGRDRIKLAAVGT